MEFYKRLVNPALKGEVQQKNILKDFWDKKEMLEPPAGFIFSRQACAGDSYTSKRFVRIATLTIFTAIVFKSLVVAEVVELFLKPPNCQPVIEFFNSKYFEII